MLSQMINLRLVLFIANSCCVFATPVARSSECPVSDPAVISFQKYIQIDTSEPDNINEAAEFIRSLAEDAGLEFAVYEPAGKPICVATWPGTEPALPSIMLNSHMDVVYAEPSEWKYPPFEAHIDDDCNLYGRGAQDTKDLGIQYIEAMRRLKNQNVQLKRTVHVTYMPDEETGGFNGMRAFLETDEFKDLNVEFVLDEGSTSETNDLYVTYQDRRAWSINFTIEGVGGHGSMMPNDVAVQKLNRLLDVMLNYRNTLSEAVKSVDPLNYGHYTSININMVNGGKAPNVIPTIINVVADMRLGTTANATEMLALVNSWAAYAGNGTKVEFLRREMESAATPIDESNIYWTAMKETIVDLGYNVIPLVLTATSDMLFVRNYGIPALGFAPKAHTVSRIHKENEYLNINTFLRGIEVYEEIIKKIADLPSTSTTCTS